MTINATAMGDGSIVLAAAALWPKVRRWVLPLLGMAVLGLLISHANKVDWAGAWAALKQYSPSLLLGVLAIATVSHTLYGCFDLVGRHHTQHHLPVWRTWAIAIASYALNLNLGSLVGGVALRTRLYYQAGVKEFQIAQVIGLGLATNWMGYSLLAGSLFAAGLVSPPGQANMSPATMRWLGVLLVLIAAVYVLACAIARGRQWTIRGRTLRLPTPQIALLQIGISALNWSLMGAMMYLLLGGQVPYGTTLCVLLAASIAGVVIPVPGGLGVLEAVYLALLSGSVPQGRLMGAILAYRALYYMVPLAGGVMLYAFLEHYASTHPASPAKGRDVAPA
ncbi:MAG: lysylphosphatidylglycerol synthase domain-containing protein [Pseudomonadota bacterium]